MKHAAIYARTSRDDDARRRRRKSGPPVIETGHREKVSVPQQVDDAKRKAAEIGCKVDPRRVYIDEDRSSKLPPLQWRKGSKGKIREEFTRLVADIEAGKIQVLIIRKRDRAVRKTWMHLEFYDLLIKHKVELVCTHESLPTSNDASGRFTLTVLAAAAEHELEKSAENTRAGMAYLKRMGMKTGSCSNVFGYYDGPEVGQVCVDEEQADVVREVFRRYVADGDSMREIALWLRTKHAALKDRHTRRGWRWGRSSVNYMIRNPRYAGLSVGEDGGLMKSAAWPFIVEMDLWRRANERAGMRSQKQVKRGARLLSGFLKCGHCGSPLHLVRRGDAPAYYQCSATVHWKEQGGKHAFAMRADDWEAWFESFYPLTARLEQKPAEATPEANELVVSASRIRENIEKLKAQAAAGKLDADEFMSMREAAGKNLAAILAKAKALPAARGPMALKKWKDMGLEERRYFISERGLKVLVHHDHAVAETKDEPTFVVDGETKFDAGRKIRFPLMQRRGEARWQHALVPKPLPWKEAFALLRFDKAKMLSGVDWSGHVGADFRSSSGAVAEKRCSSCREVKKLSEFHLNAKYRDGRCSRCKPCAIAASGKWWRENRAKGGGRVASGLAK